MTILNVTTAPQHVYVGSHTSPLPHLPSAHGEGIALLRLDPAAGTLEQVASVREDDPAFLTVSPSGRVLYGVTEVAGEAGAVWSYAIDEHTHALRPLDRHATGGGEPCYVGLDHTGRCALVTLIADGAVCAFPLDADGRLGAESARLVHSGRGVDPVWQDAPHPHAVVADPTNRLALVPDRGTDQLLVHRLDAAQGGLDADALPPVAFPPGSGPRHIALHPDGRRAYVCCELSSEVAALSLDDPMELLGIVSSVPTDFSGRSLPADIHVHPSGRFVYVANRIHESIAAFAVLRDAPGLEPIGFTAVGGEWPCGFAITPDGGLMLVACQNSDRVVVLAIDHQTGALSETGIACEVATPVCVALAGDAPATA